MPTAHPDHERIALGIRQPWIELILRGIKTVEVRTVDTRQRGTIYLYASKKFADHPAAVTAADRHDLELDVLPRGMLVGTVEIAETRPCEPKDAAAACLRRADVEGRIAWCLANPKRLTRPLPVKYLPYGVWFYPFHRKKRRVR